jgi:hypothetical protein
MTLHATNIHINLLFNSIFYSNLLIIYRFNYLFNDAFSSSDYIVLNERMISEL